MVSERDKRSSAKSPVEKKKPVAHLTKKPPLSATPVRKPVSKKVKPLKMNDPKETAAPTPGTDSDAHANGAPPSNGLAPSGFGALSEGLAEAAAQAKAMGEEAVQKAFAQATQSGDMMSKSLDAGQAAWASAEEAGQRAQAMAAEAMSRFRAATEQVVEQTKAVNEHTAAKAGAFAEEASAQGQQIAQSVRETTYRSGDAAFDMARRAADRSRRMMEQSMRTVARLPQVASGSDAGPMQSFMGSASQMYTLSQEAAADATENFRLMMASYAQFGQRMQELNAAYVELVRKAMERAAQNSQGLMQCRTFEDYMRVQREIVMDTVTHLTEAASTMMSLSSGTTQQTLTEGLRNLQRNVPR